MESLGGPVTYRQDHIPDGNFYMGLTTHKNPYDIVTISPVEVFDTRNYQKPSGADFFQWIEKKDFGPL